MPRRPRAGRWRPRAGEHLVAEVGIVEPLRAHKEHVHLAGGHLLLDRVPLLRVRRVDRPGANARPRGRLHLVAHQREQRRDDDGGAATALTEQRGRDEVHGRLAPAGPLHHQGPPVVGDQRLDGPPLVLAQSRAAGRVRDETGEHGIGGGPERGAVFQRVCVGHASMQPDASDIARMSTEPVDNSTRDGRPVPGVIHRGFGIREITRPS